MYDIPENTLCIRGQFTRAVFIIINFIITINSNNNNILLITTIYLSLILALISIIIMFVTKYH